jgi:Zn-finger nucleic acid-binding protein
MKDEAGKSSAANEVRFELKYCERCGGLWLRPAGSGQIYCVECGRQMAEMPAPSRERANPKLPRGPRSIEGEFDDEDGLDLDAAGGAA